MSDDSEHSGTQQRTTLSETVVVSMDRFSTIPQRRRRYIAMYLAMMAMWVATTIVGIRTQVRNEETAASETVTVMGDAASDNETAAGSDGAEAASTAEGDFAETRKMLLEQRPILYLQVATGVCMALFYLNFVGVLMTMGYPVIMILGICLACFFPLPGLLVVAAIDRRVSKAWHAALPNPD